jgi:hypothetical protein
MTGYIGKTRPAGLEYSDGFFLPARHNQPRSAYPQILRFLSEITTWTVYSQRWGCEMGEWHPHRTWDEAAMSFPEAVTSPKNSKSGPLYDKASPGLKATAIHNKWISLCENADVSAGATFQF